MVVPAALCMAAQGLVGWMGMAAAATTAPSVPARDVYFGVTVEDPFRNLEDLQNPDTRRWMLGQGEQAAAQLARIEGRDALRQRLIELDKSSGDRSHSYTRRAGGRLFYLTRPAGQSQFKLVMRQGLRGAEHVLVNELRIEDLNTHKDLVFQSEDAIQDPRAEINARLNAVG